MKTYCSRRFFYSILVGSILFSLVVFGYRERASLGWLVWDMTHAASLATALNTTDAGLYFTIGNSYFGEGRTYDVERAKVFFLRAQKLDDRYPSVHYQLARVYFIEGSFSPALREINRELELYPDFKRSYYVRALIYGYMRLFELAAADFQEFLLFKPESWAAHNDLAWIYFQMGAYDKALTTVEEGLVDSPQNMWLLNSRGVALLNLGRKEEARKSLRLALAIVNITTPEQWGRSYPGNNPNIYGQGLGAMRTSIEKNLALLAQ
jgi:tetratricopeptide (TPR) repeat protein